MGTSHKLWLITGTPGAGKTSIARELAFRLESSVHIEIDTLRWMVCAGFVSPRTQLPQAREQFALARHTASYMALEYLPHFDVILDDVVPEDEIGDFGDVLTNTNLHKVLLYPSLEETLRRNLRRTNKGIDPRVLEPAITRLHPQLGQKNTPEAGWFRIDTTNLSVSATVDALLKA